MTGQCPLTHNATTTVVKAAASVPDLPEAAETQRGNNTLTHNMPCASEAKSGH